MNARFLVLIGAMVGLGIAGSFVLENQSTGGAGQQSEADIWREPAQPINYSNSSDRFLSALSTGRLFPNTAPRNAVPPGEPVLEENGPTIFPTLISISRRDGTYKALVAFDDGQRATVKKGDLLVDEWTVGDLTSEALVAQLGSDFVRIPLFLTED
jgi:hypothetical protein